MSALTCEHCGQRHEDGVNFCPVTGKITHPERYFPPGTLIDGKYRLAGVLGSGGMGAVFDATHTMLDKRVAVKLMLPEMARDRELMSRMVREARTASASGHRNVIAVTDMGWTAEGALFLVMEYLEGRTLRQLIREAGPQPVERSANLVFQILSALAAVHARGIIHRDLKPDNIMVIAEADDGQGAGELVKVLDFGISKILRSDQDLNLTRTGSVLGSPRYMAPEQARGRPVDERTDIYAVGGILYHLLTGRPALRAPNFAAMIAVILKGDVDPPSTYAPGIPTSLDAVVLKAMARDPEIRFPDARAFRQALRPFMGKVGVGSRAWMGRLEVKVSQGPASDLSGLDEGEEAAATRVDRAASPEASPRSEVHGTEGRDEALAGVAPVLAEPVPEIADVELLEISIQVAAASPAEPSLQVAAADRIEVTPPTVANSDRGLEPLASRLEPLASPSGSSADSPRRGTKGLDLDLDVDDAWRRDHSAKEVVDPPYVDDRPAPQAKGTLYAHGRPWRRLGAFFFPLLILIVLGVGGYHYRHSILGWFSADGTTDLSNITSRDSSILLWVKTVPRRADIYLDGIWQSSTSIALPRSDHEHRLRVQAAGYLTKTMMFRADKTRRVTIRLTRRRR